MVSVLYGIQSILLNSIPLFPNQVSHYNTMSLLCHRCLLLKIDLGSPTSVDFVQSDQMLVVSYSTAKVVIYDVETGKAVVTLDSGLTYGIPIT